MTDTQNTPPSDTATDSPQDLTPACVMCFNAGDPSGAGGLTADVSSIMSVGAHPLAVTTAVYVRDSAEIFEHHALDEELVIQQARGVLEDMPVQAVKVGFLGSTEAISVVAELATDYADIPLIAYMPSLNWWDGADADSYFDAFFDLLLPQTSLLIGSHGTLARWLLPDWPHERAPSARDIAKAAAAQGVPYVLVTGIVQPGGYTDNQLATPETVLASRAFEHFEVIFTGAGDTLSAAITALLASGCNVEDAFNEALSYLDQALAHGFRPGMGNVIPDRLFWAQGEADETGDEAETALPTA
ncbi:MAG: Hydroxymethylpyrimidine/phosphomethylpyrimidine kinase [Paracidovorax wautersii]|uniref:Hydroxymethylpyrimidine/phosphomethylpyrimidine kinase n=1 Tax=Paracidovorax wautersii TaxID=1177982 RepID=A0A7V8JRV9_9BURK|nr:MAG: Hydroxymethylpyrimidine/phosphomethylpyrimidine kinase [Paracidovorax wautersii]